MSENDEPRYWRKFKRDRQELHRQWAAANKEILDKSGLPFEERPDSVILREAGKPRVNFFLTTGRWQNIDTGKLYSGGAEQFIAWYKLQ